MSLLRAPPKQGMEPMWQLIVPTASQTLFQTRQLSNIHEDDPGVPPPFPSWRSDGLRPQDPAPPGGCMALPAPPPWAPPPVTVRTLHPPHRQILTLSLVRDLAQGSSHPHPTLPTRKDTHWASLAQRHSGTFENSDSDMGGWGAGEPSPTSEVSPGDGEQCSLA